MDLLIDEKRGSEFSWLTGPRFAVLLWLLVLAGHPDAMLGLASFFFRDFLQFGYPLAHYHKWRLWSGGLPLWNPLSSCGLPFLAQWNTMTLYPGTLIYLLLPLPWSLNLFQLLHQVLAGLGMFYLARQQTGNPLAAALAGAGFAFSGLVEQCLMWPNNMAGMAWMPWVALALGRAARGGLRETLAAAAAGTVQLFSGAPEVIFFTWVIALPLAVGETANWRERGKALGRLAGAGLLTLGLGAIQLLPFLDLLAHSNRHAGPENGLWSLPPSGLANFFLPVFRMAEGAPGILAQPGQSWTISYYVSLPLLAAALAALTLRRAAPRVLGLLTLLSLLLALGEKSLLFRWWQATIGGLGWIRFPVKLVIVSTFAFPLLAAYALSQRRRRLTPAVLVVAAATLALMILALARPAPAPGPGAILTNGLGRLAILAAFAILLGLAFRPGGRNRRRILLGGGCLLLVWIDLRTHLPDYNPTTAAAVMAPGLVRPDPGPGPANLRVMVSREALERQSRAPFSDRPLLDNYRLRLGLFFDCNLLDGLPKTDGFFSMYPLETFRVQQRLYSSPAAVPPPAGLLDFLGVARLTRLGRLAEFDRRPTAMPLVSGGQAPRFASDAAALEAIFKDSFDPRSVVFLPESARSRIRVRGPERVIIQMREAAPERISFLVETPGPALVVLAQTYYHAWKAWVNGRAAELLRANVAYQAVEIPAGRSEVRLSYRDGAFRAGGLISLTALLGCLGLGLWSRRRLRARSSRAASLQPPAIRV